MVETVRVFRVSGVAWAAAPCGCCVRLLAPRDVLHAFVQHVIDKTPDHAEIQALTIERDR